MASHNEIIGLLQRNANANDYFGSTAPVSAGRLRKKAAPKKRKAAGGAKKKKAKPKAAGAKRKPAKMKAGVRSHPRTVKRRGRASSTPFATERYGFNDEVPEVRALPYEEPMLHRDMPMLSHEPSYLFDPSLITGEGGYIGGRYLHRGGEYIGGEYIGGCMHCMKQGSMCHHCSAGMRHHRRVRGGAAGSHMVREELDELKQELDHLREEVHELKCYV